MTGPDAWKRNHPDELAIPVAPPMNPRHLCAFQANLLCREVGQLVWVPPISIDNSGK